MNILAFFQQCYFSHSNWPSLRLRHIKNRGNGYTASCRGGELEITASSPLHLSFGIAQSMVGLLSGYQEEFLGEIAPLYPLRALWFTDSCNYHLPTVVQMGYNCIIVEEGSFFSSDLQVAVNITIDCPCRDPLHSDYRHYLESKIASVDPFSTIFYKSQLAHPSFSSSSYTQLELVAAEMALLEQLFPSKQLIFYVDDPTVQWLAHLCDLAQPSTSIAFCSSETIWESLRRQKDPSSTSLLPLLPIEGGLWPCLPFEAIDQRVGQMGQGYFSGVVVQVSHCPAATGLLACSLWTAGHAQWFRHPAHYLAKAWFAAYRPDLQFSTHRSLFAAAEVIESILLKLKRAEGGQGVVEIAIANLKYIENWLDFESTSLSLATTLSDYFRYFVRDARSMIFYYIDILRLVAPPSPPVEYSGGFWTDLKQEGGRCTPGSATVALLSKPRVLSEDPRMDLVFKEN